jgi:hypothetical protein
MEEQLCAVSEVCLMLSLNNVSARPSNSFTVKDLPGGRRRIGEQRSYQGR